MKMEECNNDTQRAKVAAGFKGGNQFTSLIQHPAMTVVDGIPAESKEKYLSAPTPQIPTVSKEGF